MYNVTTVTDTLFGLVGFRQPHLDGVDPIDSDLAASTSGLYIDYNHPLITAKNLIAAAVDFPEAYDRPEWSEDETYAKDALVQYTDEDDAAIYRSLKESNTSAISVEVDWRKTTPLSVFLRRVMADSVGDVLSAVRTKKLKRIEGKTRLVKTELYNDQGSVTDSITPADRFVAIRITPLTADSALLISSLGIQLTGRVSDLPIYIYGDEQDPILIQNVTTTISGRFAWPLAWTPVRVSGSSQYYVGYYEEDLPEGVQAVRRNRTISNVCIGCNPGNFILYNRWSKWFAIDAIRVDPVMLESDRSRWEVGGEDVVDNQNYGLNLSLTIECDITGILVSQAALFADALRQQIVVKLLNAIAYSAITSGIEQLTRGMAMRALGLDGTPNVTSEPDKLEELIDGLDIELSGLSADCLPTSGSGGLIKNTNVWAMQKK